MCHLERDPAESDKASRPLSSYAADSKTAGLSLSQLVGINYVISLCLDATVHAPLRRCRAMVDNCKRERSLADALQMLRLE